MNSKKQTEKNIFNLIYSQKENFDAVHSDKPDFIVSREGQKTFGVEVTQLFQNESSARLLKIPSYTADLLDSKKYRHKMDIENLKVHKIEIEKPTGEKIETTAIIQDTIAPKHYLQLMEQRLHSKNKSIQGYQENLEHINLLIQDTSDVFSTIKHKHFYSCFYTENIINRLLQSKFREVYLITRIDKQNIFFPLKSILFTSTIVRFHEVIRLSKKIPKDLNMYYAWQSEYLDMLGFNGVQLIEINKKTLITYGNTGFALENMQIVLKDFGDWAIPFGHEPEKSTFIDSEVESIINEVKNKFTFKAELGYKTR
jgi:hypothetical protein